MANENSKQQDAASATPDELRAKLFERVRLGELSPEEAKEQARDQGLPNIVGDADPSIFNPMAEPDWPLLMAVAWIVFRDDHQVRLCADPYRTKCTYFAPFKAEGMKKTGYCLETKERANRLYLDMTHARFAERGLHVEMNVDQATKELRSELRAAKNIAASGERNGERQEIGAQHWTGLQFFPHNEAPDTVVSKKVRFEEVRLPREEVMKRWPPRNAEASDEQGIAQGAERHDTLVDSGTPDRSLSLGRTPREAMEDDYKTYVANRVQNPRSPSEADDLAHMRSLSWKISRKRLRELRKEHAPDSWKRPGTKKQLGP